MGRSKVISEQRATSVGFLGRLMGSWRSFFGGGQFYESTRTDESCDLGHHFENADDGSADAHASNEARRDVRIRARFECANNGWLKGMGRTYRNDCVGTGPRLQIVSGFDQDVSEDISREIEFKFHQWLKDIRYSRKLGCQVLAKRRDGEGLGIFYPIEAKRPREQFGNPVKWNYRLLDCDRLQNHFSDLGNTAFVDGIKYDEYGDPELYRFLKEHPGSDKSMELTDGNPYQVVEAQYVVHLFEMDRPEQTRGISEYQPSLIPAALFRQFTKAVVRAARNSARFWGIIKTALPPLQTTSETPSGKTITTEPRCDTGETMSLEDNMLKALPDGYDAQLLDAKHPSTSHNAFTDVSINEMGRPVNMPLNKARGNSSVYNFASGKLDFQDYGKDIKIDRHELCEMEASDRAFAIWWSEATRLTGYLSNEARSLRGPNDYPQVPHHVWQWDGIDPDIDPTKSANADTERLRNGTATLGEILARRGLNVDEVIDKGARELGISADEYRAKLIDYLFASPAAAMQERDAEDEQPENTEAQNVG